MRRFARLLLVSTLITLVLGGGSLFVSSAASAQSMVRDTGSEAGFLASINAQRAAAGLGPLTLSGSMTSAAAGWTEQMVNGSFLAHAGDIITGTPGGWNKVGENVGRGQSVASLTQAFMGSAGHRANILDAGYTHIGIAVYVHPTDGRLYTTHRFAALTGSAPAPAAPAPAPPTAVPAAPTPVPVQPTPVPAQPTPVPPAPVPPTPVPAAPTPAPVQPTAVVVASTTSPRPDPTAQPRPTAAANSVPAEQPTSRPQPTTPPSSASDVRTGETVTTSGTASFGQAPEQLAFVDSETAARNFELKLRTKVAKVARGARS